MQKCACHSPSKLNVPVKPLCAMYHLYNPAPPGTSYWLSRDCLWLVEVPYQILCCTGTKQCRHFSCISKTMRNSLASWSLKRFSCLFYIRPFEVLVDVCLHRALCWHVGWKLMSNTPGTRIGPGGWNRTMDQNKNMTFFHIPSIFGSKYGWTSLNASVKSLDFDLGLEDSDLRTPTWGLWLEDSDSVSPRRDV